MLTTAFVAVGVLNLLAAYIWALHAPSLQLPVLVPMLLVSAWHIAENDVALSRAYREGLRLGAVPQAARHHLLAAGWTAGVGALALSTPSGAQVALLHFGRVVVPTQAVFSIDELATAVLLYHAVSWLVFFEDRARALPAAAARQLRGRLLAIHAAPLCLNGALYLGLPSVHFDVAAPTLYLFWSVLHAVQTAYVRGLEPSARLRATSVPG